MFTVKKATTVAVAALVATGALAGAAPASASSARQGSENVRFFNEDTGGALDANSTGGSAVSWAPNGTDYQAWILRFGSQGGLQIESKARVGQCLQAPENFGDPIAVVTCNKYVPTQWWVLPMVGDKHVIALQQDPEKVIESTPTGNPVFQGFYDGNPRQLWDASAA
ncbi:hypothetical protein ACFY2K_20005 [Kitasatospora sp. NPDC001309]|uniref:hypothetical protein n=1 Tax=Kitasatospora sp. NPDC001309 TaxID=3364013 RepID=UPI0036A8A010